MSETKNYVNESALFEELKKSLEQEKLTNKASEILTFMTDRYLNKLAHKSIEQKEFCRQISLEASHKYWKEFPVDKPNIRAFPYMTQIIKSGFAKGWRLWEAKEKAS